MSSVTVTIPVRHQQPYIKVGEFVRFKSRRKGKDRFAMCTSSSWTDEIFQANLILPKPLKKKNGYTVDRLKKIYKHKPKKEYFV